MTQPPREQLPAAVRRLLAYRLGRDATSIHAWQRLADDLDVRPLQLVLVALALEELTLVSLPIDELGRVETVGDLLALAQRVRVDEALRPTPPCPIGACEKN